MLGTLECTLLCLHVGLINSIFFVSCTHIFRQKFTMSLIEEIEFMPVKNSTEICLDDNLVYDPSGSFGGYVRRAIRTR
jgi:hypothetical protein